MSAFPSLPSDAPVLATITVDEITRRLHTSEPTVYRLLEQKQIPALRIGRKWLISRQRYERWEASFGDAA